MRQAIAVRGMLGRRRDRLRRSGAVRVMPGVLRRRSRSPAGVRQPVLAGGEAEPDREARDQRADVWEATHRLKTY